MKIILKEITNISTIYYYFLTTFHAISTTFLRLEIQASDIT